MMGIFHGEGQASLVIIVIVLAQIMEFHGKVVVIKAMKGKKNGIYEIQWGKLKSSMLIFFS